MNELGILRALRNGDISKVQAYTMLRMKWDGHVDGAEYAEWATGYDPSERSVEGASDECCEAELCGEDGCESYGCSSADSAPRSLPRIRIDGDEVALVILGRRRDGSTFAHVLPRVANSRMNKRGWTDWSDIPPKEYIGEIDVSFTARPSRDVDGEGGCDTLMRTMEFDGPSSASDMFDTAWREYWMCE